MNIITKVEEGSIAMEVGLTEGDVLVSINGREVNDIFDYRYLIRDENLEIVINKLGGEEWTIEIQKDEDEDLGLEYEYPLMSHEKSCKNKCIFCFIDQNPKGMRDTIYFKDDDSRLSFLEGNFVTLTNMKDSELDRVIFYRLSPINISVHTTDSDLRVYMLKNPRASLIMQQIQKITSAGIITNFQIVLCKGINDGKHLDKTIQDLSTFLPFGQHLSIVPLGMSAHRQSLPKLTAWDKNGANEVILQVEAWQKKFKKSHGTNFVFLADEFYILAGKRVPENNEYEEYNQISNGIGMVRNFIEEFKEEQKEMKFKGDIKKLGEVSVATGVIAYSYIKEITTEIEEDFGIKIHTYPITNDFYGGGVTVAGLLTGGDIIGQLKNKRLGNKLLLPKSLLKNNEELLLDNVTINDIQKALGVSVEACGIHGGEFLNRVLGIKGIEVPNAKTYG